MSGRFIPSLDRGWIRRQLTFFREGVTAPLPQSTAAWYAPGGGSFIFAKDTRRRRRNHAALPLRLDHPPDDAAHGWKVTHRFASVGTSARPDRVRLHRRGGQAAPSRPLRDESARAGVGQAGAAMEGPWSVEAWSPDDRELLVVTRASAGRAAPVAGRREHRREDAADRTRRYATWRFAAVFGRTDDSCTPSAIVAPSSCGCGAAILPPDRGSC